MHVDAETVERSDFFFSDALHPWKPFYGLKMRMNKIKTMMITYVIEIDTPLIIFVALVLVARS